MAGARSTRWPSATSSPATATASASCPRTSTATCRLPTSSERSTRTHSSTAAAPSPCWLPSKMPRRTGLPAARTSSASPPSHTPTTRPSAPSTPSWPVRPDPHRRSRRVHPRRPRRRRAQDQLLLPRRSLRHLRGRRHRRHTDHRDTVLSAEEREENEFMLVCVSRACSSSSSSICDGGVRSEVALGTSRDSRMVPPQWRLPSAMPGVLHPAPTWTPRTRSNTWRSWRRSRRHSGDSTLRPTTRESRLLLRVHLDQATPSCAGGRISGPKKIAAPA